MRQLHLERSGHDADSWFENVASEAQVAPARHRPQSDPMFSKYVVTYLLPASNRRSCVRKSSVLLRAASKSKPSRRAALLELDQTPRQAVAVVANPVDALCDEIHTEARIA